MQEYPDIRPLKLGAKNNAVPLVILGYGNFIHTVEEALRDVCPVWAFALPNHIEFYIWNGNPDQLTVFNMAKVYADLILKYVPGKKIMLTGHSFFGLVAFEVARQLKETSIETDLVVLIDTYLKRAPTFTLNQQIINFCRHGKLLPAARHLLLQLAERRGWQPHPNPQTNQVQLPDLKESEAAITQFAGSTHFIKWVECGTLLTEIRRQAVLAYLIKPLACIGILIRVEISEHEIKHGFLPDFGWRAYFQGGLTIVKTEGDHSTIVENPYKAALSEKMRKIISNRL